MTVATSALAVILIAWALFLALAVAALAMLRRRADGGDQRRRVDAPFDGPDRRGGADRRTGSDRRNGSDRRSGPADRRVGLPDLRADQPERRRGPTDRRSGEDRRSGRDRRQPVPVAG